MMGLIKKLLKKIKRIMIRIFGSKTDRFYWRFRHVFDRDWPKSYLSHESLTRPRRKMLIDKISNYYPLESVLEIGCASGPNIHLLAEKFPKVKIYGFDISKKAIEEGKRFLKGKNVFLTYSSPKILKSFSDKSIDIVFSNAALIYLSGQEITFLAKEMVRIAKKGIILFELHHDLEKSTHFGNWVHNYRKLFHRFVSDENINISRIPLEFSYDEVWKKFGHIVEIKL